MLTIGYVILYARYTRRPPAGAPEFVREPPTDLPPALVGMLFDAAATPDEMAATLLDLVRRGAITMNSVRMTTTVAASPSNGEDRALHLHRDKVAGLSPGEQELVYELFDHIGRGADDVLLSDLRRWWAEHPATATVAAQYWGIRLRGEAASRGLLGQGDRRALILMLYGLPGCWVIPLVITLAVNGAAVLTLLLMLPLGILMAAWASRATNLTDRGFELAVAYDGLRRYLETFGRMDEKPAEAVALWEQYLPLAVVLGLARDAMDDIYVMPPGWVSYGRAGRAGRRAFRRGTRHWGHVRLPDKDEAIAYSAFRRGYDPSLPAVHVNRVEGNDSIWFGTSSFSFYVSSSQGLGIGSRHVRRGTRSRLPLLVEVWPIVALTVLPVVLALIAAR